MALTPAPLPMRGRGAPDPGRAGQLWRGCARFWRLRHRTAPPLPHIGWGVGCGKGEIVFYEVIITRSDAGGGQWIANDVRVLRRSRDVAYREGWWLHRLERTGPVVSLRYVAADGATMEQRVRFIGPNRLRARRR